MSIKHLIKTINMGAINCPVGSNGLGRFKKEPTRSLLSQNNKFGANLK